MADRPHIRPVPRPPKRRCNRYYTDGTPCTIASSRADGWCGHCDGFTTPSVAGGSVRTRWFRRNPTGLPWIPTKAPLDADEAYEVRISHRAQTEFVSHHSCSPQEAETQIRSLLEDLLLDGEVDQEKEGTGAYRLMFRSAGYLLLLSGDLETVMSYQTVHRERTWSQFKAGVRSRVSATRKAPPWARDTIAAQTGAVRLTYSAVRSYAVDKGWGRPEPDTLEEFLARACAAAERDLLPMLNAPLPCAEPSLFPCGEERAWMAVGRGEGDVLVVQYKRPRVQEDVGDADAEPASAGGC